MPNARRLYVDKFNQILAGTGGYGTAANLRTYGQTKGYDTFQYYDIQSVLPAMNVALSNHIIAARAAGIPGHICVGSQTATVRNLMINYDAWVIANLGINSLARFNLPSHDGINAEDYPEWYTYGTSAQQMSEFSLLIANMVANKKYVEITSRNGLSAQTYMGWFKPMGQETPQAAAIAANSLQFPGWLPFITIGGLQVSVYGAAGNYGIGYSVGNPPRASQFKGQLQTRCNYLAAAAFALGRKLPISVLFSAETPPPASAAFQGTWFNQSPANTPLAMFNTWVVPAFADVQAAVPGGNGNMLELEGFSVFSYTRIRLLLP